MLVKVCGMIEQKQAYELEQHVDMMGFIYYDKSPRFVSKAPETTQCLRVGVFVNETIEKIKEIGQRDKLDIIQLHGNESAAICKELAKSFRIVKAFGIDQQFNFDQLKPFEGLSYFLFDTKTQAFGGSGKQFDWKTVKNYTLSTPFLLSGGIQANDALAIKKISHSQLTGIDINSGFEISQGQKNVERIKTFIHEFRN